MRLQYKTSIRRTLHGKYESPKSRNQTSIGLVKAALRWHVGTKGGRPELSYMYLPPYSLGAKHSITQILERMLDLKKLAAGLSSKREKVAQAIKPNWVELHSVKRAALV